LKNTRYSLIAGLLFSLIPTFSQVAYAAELKVGFVNILKILDSAPQAKNADARLKKEFAPRDSQLVKSKDDLRRLEERIRKEEDIMSPQEVTRLTQDIRGKRRDLEREQDAFREDFNLRRNEEISKLQKEIFNAIVSLSKEEGYDLVVGEGVIFASERIDITQKVLGRLR